LGTPVQIIKKMKGTLGKKFFSVLDLWNELDDNTVSVDVSQLLRGSIQEETQKIGLLSIP